MKPIFFTLTTIIICACAMMQGCSCSSSDHEDSASLSEAADTVPPHPPVPTKLRVSRSVGNLGRQFNDLNPAHLDVARRLGIRSIRSLRDIWHMRKPIVAVDSCADFTVDELTHSHAYLVPEAAALLHDIGRAFNDSLAARGGGRYQIKVTSLLRTAESVGRLKRGNVNSVENSAHLYGTTFDISYTKFPRDPEASLPDDPLRTDGDLKNLLAEILLDMRAQGRCLVKFERKQGCFHITARQ